MKNLQDRPRAILFARLDKEEHKLYLDNRMAMVRRYARENEYWTLYGSFSIIPVKWVETAFLPWITAELLPSLEEELGLKPPYPITIIVCFWEELVSNKRRPIFKEKLEKMGITVKEIGNK